MRRQFRPACSGVDKRWHAASGDQLCIHLQLRPVTDTDQTYTQWTSGLDCAPDAERELRKIVLGVYQGEFDSLRGKFSR